MKVRKIINYLLIVVLSLMFYVYNVPIDIDKEFEALEISMTDPDFLQTCKVYVQGKYHKNLFGSDSFQGKIFTSNEPLTQSRFLGGYIIDTELTLKYLPNEENLHVIYYYGTAEVLGHFDDILLVIDEDKFGPLPALGEREHGDYVVASVSSREEALERIYNSISYKRWTGTYISD